jgi:type II restriction enzyme
MGISQLGFDLSVLNNLKSNSQKARMLTENWIETNMFCPRCGCSRLIKSKNNLPVNDFGCQSCGSAFELKSKSSQFNSTVPDGAYSTMIDMILTRTNPDFMFMHYDISSYSIQNLFVVPKHFFTPMIIEKRKPLSENARRAGWVGCNIKLDQIPEQGRIFVVRQKMIVSSDSVVSKLRKTSFLENTDVKSRGWIIDIINCINKLGEAEFGLDDLYAFESELGALHQNNKNIKPKIRQQLQFLRDKGFINFLGEARYVLV